MLHPLLQETGVGKTVNSFRKHEVAGEMAKSLVAKWKKLVPQSADRYCSLHLCHTMQPAVRGGAAHVLAPSCVSVLCVSVPASNICTGD